jgi:hypothetical protein
MQVAGVQINLRPMAYGCMAIALKTMAAMSNKKTVFFSNGNGSYFLRSIAMHL